MSYGKVYTVLDSLALFPIGRKGTFARDLGCAAKNIRVCGVQNHQMWTSGARFEF